MTPVKFFIIVLLTVLVLFCGVGTMVAHADNDDREYKLKAAFLLNFSKFITWPKEAFAQNGQSFDFCVVGEDPFGTALEGLESKKVGGRKVRLHYMDQIAETRTCHLLFVSKSEEGKLGQLLHTLDGRPVVTVSDIQGFSHKGGLIEFITKAGRLAFIVNNQEASQNGLQVNASLLNLAAEVL